MDAERSAFGGRLAAAGLIVALVALAYGNSLPNPFQYDDRIYIVENEYVRAWPGPLRYLRPPCVESSGVISAFYRPLPRLSFYASFVLTGESPFGFRVVDLALHAGVALLVWALARHLLGRLAHDGRFSARAVGAAALLAGAIVAVHPLANQTINQVSKRDTLLAVSLMLGALLAYLSAWARASEPGGRWLRPLCLGAFLEALALTAKEIAVALPLLLILCDWLFVRGVPRRRRLAVHAVAVALVSALVIAFVVWAAGGHFPRESADGPLPPTSQYVLGQPGVLVRYLALLVSPSGLSVYHEVAPVASPLAPAVLLPLAGLLALAAGAVALRRRCPEVTLALLGGLGSFAPTSLVTNRIAMEEDRAYTLLACVGLMAGALLARGFVRVAARHARLARSFGVAVAVALVACLALLSAARNREWATPARLWEAAALRYPASRAVLLNYAGALSREGREEERLALLSHAARLHPHDVRVRVFLAHALARAHRDEEAGQLWAELVREAPDHPEVLLLSGHLHRAQGAWAEAAAAYERALLVDGGSVTPLIYLAEARLRLGRVDEARRLVMAVPPHRGLSRGEAQVLEAVRARLR